MIENKINFIGKETAQSKPYLQGEFSVVNAPESVLESQRAAREIIHQLVLPGDKDEPWRKTNISKLPLAALSLAGETQIKLSNAPEGVAFLTLKEAMRQIPELLNEKLNKLVQPDTDKFSALAAGYAQNGFVLVIPPNSVVEDTLEATIFIAQDGSIQNSQVLVVVGENASATLHLTYTDAGGQTAALHSGTVEVYLEDNAHFHLVEQQQLGRESWYFSHEKASVGNDAVLDWVYFAFGTKLTKSFIDLSLSGKGSEARVDGLTITNSGQHIDLDTQQDHLAPNTFSNLNFKAALMGDSNNVWQGMIYVDPAAVQTDGYQTSHSLILDKRAHAEAIPGL
ncbi:MAG: SufD family Fe-S cluster assembly protein [Anaerolineaceae bacterium]|nr:SufD family Fe-S cluster assembly protein [Anaerolineaceae bacterium]